MMKTIIILFLLLTGFAEAQTHRYLYEFQYKPDSTQQDYSKTVMTLDINPTEVKFYPYKLAEMDSINKAKGYNSVGWYAGVPALKRVKGSDKNLSYELIGDGFYSLSSDDPISWKLTNETKELGGYHLQKAITHFGGRDWTAWFTDQIPFQEGPYKFRGLPGLIFEIHDSQNNFSFTLVKSRNLPETYDTTKFIESFAGTKALHITDKIYLRKKLEIYNDPLHNMKLRFKENKNPGTTFVYNGTEVKNADQFHDLEIDARNYILKNNNPIERSKIIHYPKL